MSDIVEEKIVKEVVRDLVEDVTMFMEIQDEDEDEVPQPKKRKTENECRKVQNSNVFSKSASYSGPNRSGNPQNEPAMENHFPNRGGMQEAARETRVNPRRPEPLPGHVVLVHPVHDVILQIPEDALPILRGPLDQGIGLDQMPDLGHDALQIIENLRNQMAQYLAAAQAYREECDLRSEEENAAGPSGQ